MLKKLIITAACLCLLLPCFALSVSAGENTTYTYTVSVEEKWIRTQDAYRSGKVYMQNAGLAKPQDLFYKNNTLYIADSGNARVLIHDLATERNSVIGEGILAEPAGIFVCDDGTIYVADPMLGAVVIFNADGTENSRITRPESYLFNNQSVYKPKNVVVTSQGNIFVVGEGAYEGLMQFDRGGTFQGYYAANKRNLSMLESLQEAIFTEKQKSQLLTRIPRAIQNIDLADRDMIFSITQGEKKETAIGSGQKYQNYLKKHNMNGLNVLSSNSNMTEEWNFADVSKGNCNNVYALTETGLIYEYDESGNLLFSFGGRAVSSDRNGLFTVAAALDVDENGIIYILDGERGIVQTFFPTEFAAITHSAINELSSGDYESSEKIWNSLLKLNGNSAIAHLGYGKALLRQGKYKTALEHFKICGNRTYYSQAFWEIRSNILNRIMPAVIVVAAFAAVLYEMRRFYRKKHGIDRKTVTRKQSVIKRMMLHPIDTFYDLKHGKCGSVFSATAVYFATFAVFVADMLARSYLFKKMDIAVIPPASVPLMFFVPLTLWIFGNRMISSICEGEGSFKSIYITTAYSGTPYIVITPFIVILTYVLSLNEQFIVSLLWIVALVWTAVLLIIGIIQVHNYTLVECLKNILLILFFMIMAVVTLVILYLIWTQVFGYLYDLFGELNYNLFVK